MSSSLWNCDDFTRRFYSKQPQNLLFTNEELTCLISSTTEEMKLIYEGQIILPHIMKFLILLYIQ